MAASFPASYDALTNPTAGSLLTSPSHATQHINANDVVEAIEQRVGLSGSSFPGSPSSGQFFHHTTRRLDYYYDGTRWLTTYLYEWPIGSYDLNMPFTATSVAARGGLPEAGNYDLWLVGLRSVFYVVGGTALGASHKWVITYNKQPAGTNIATINIDSGSSSVYRTLNASIGALLGTTNFAVDATATKTGTPGDLHAFAILSFRMVG
jgi:hypothetical protein